MPLTEFARDFVDGAAVPTDLFGHSSRPGKSSSAGGVLIVSVIAIAAPILVSRFDWFENLEGVPLSAYEARIGAGGRA